MADSKHVDKLNEDRKLSKSQQKRLKQYQALGTNSKARSDKVKFDARYAALYQKSFSRRKKLDKLSMYQTFCEILCIRSSRTLNPSNFLDFLASLVTLYTGTNQTVSVSKYTSNNHNSAPLAITHIDQLIPYHAPRDKISFSQQNETEVNIYASYAFGALPDQRLFNDNKCTPYIMDESFRWIILYGTRIKPPNFRGRRTSFEKVVAAAIISDGCGASYCVYGTRNGLFYNKNKNGKAVKLIDEMVDAIFRQNDYLFVVCQGPVLYNVSLTTKKKEIAVSEMFRTKKRYAVYTFFDSFIGGYYDKDSDRLILGTNNAKIYVFQNNGSMDSKFNYRFTHFCKNKDKIEKGNLMYYDVDRNAVVYIGTKYVMKISLDKNKKGVYRVLDDEFGKIHDIKWFLRGITYDCNHFLYIYHQKTLIVLKKMQSSANYPYVLKIYTGKSLRFE